jgi:hypothetical protein
MLKRKTRKSIRKRLDVNDEAIVKMYESEMTVKNISDYDFKKFIDCDVCYLCNYRKGSAKEFGSVLIMVKNNIVLDILGPLYKIYFESEDVQGETVYCQVIAKNKIKIKHDYFKLAVSKRKETIVIRPRNIFKEEFLYHE